MLAESFTVGWRHMKQILLMIAVVALVGCGKKEPVQPSVSNPEATNPEKETGKETTQPTTPNTETTKPVAPYLLWGFETGYHVVSSPAIGSDGTVYVGSKDNKLYAINGKSGVKLWEFETGDGVYSSPAIGSDGTVYVGSFDKKLYAIKTDSQGLAKSPWPMRGQNALHTGRTTK